MTGRAAGRTLAIVVLCVTLSTAPVAGLDAVDRSERTPTAIDATGIGSETNADVASGGCVYPLSRVDATNTTVTLAEPPERVVTLAPSAAQTVWEINASDRVVGLTSYAHYLEGAESKTTVGGFSIDVERVVNLTPDIVLAPNITSKDTVRKLRESGVTVYHFREATSIEFIAQKTELTGRLVGACTDADERAETMRDRVDTIRRASAAVDPADRPWVLHILGSSGYVAGRNTFVDMVIETAGGNNVAAGDGYYVMNREEVIYQDPQWITRPREFDMSPYNSTTAVEKDQVVTLDENYVSQPAPRIVIPMIELIEHLHPAVYREARLGHLESETRAEAIESGDPISVSVGSDGVATLRVDGGEEGETAFEIPPIFDNDSAVRLRWVNVTSVEPRPEFTVYVTPVDGVARPTAPDNVTFLSAYGVRESELFGQPRNVTYSVEVSRENVTAAGGTPATLALYRYNGSVWERLPVRARSVNNGTVRLTAEVGDLSLVAVGVTPPPESTSTQSSDQTTPTTDTPETTVSPTATATPPPTVSPTATATSTAAPGAAGSTTGASGPGFGLLGTILGLLVALSAAGLRRTRW